MSESLRSVLGDLSDDTKRNWFQDIENDLKTLGNDAWDDLKKKVTPHLQPRGCRGWQQLYDRLNEAKGYNHLVGLGCTDVQFIPEGKEKAPDLTGALNNTTILCEVKTINPSKEEVQARNKLNSDRWRTVNITPTLNPSLLENKFTNVIKAAQEQISAFRTKSAPSNDFCSIILIVLNYDDNLGECYVNYENQMRNFAQERNLAPGCEIKLFSRSVFKP
jgi:hypothetical protein